MDTVREQSAWKRFWNKGRWWKALILVVAYLVLFNLASLLLLPFASDTADPESAIYVLISYVIPILFGGVILVAFGASVGWLRDIFGPQPIKGRGWMWIAVGVVLLTNILRFATIDYSAAGFEYVMTWLLAGLFIGFAEELITRGYVVRIMRSAGHPEIAVALVSAALFALMHATNLLSGQAIVPTLLQVVYTFFFGILMYLALRVTGTIIAPILLHASTDPSIFLQAGFPATGPLATVAGLGNFAVMLAGLVLLFFIRGRVDTSRASIQIQDRHRDAGLSVHPDQLCPQRSSEQGANMSGKSVFTAEEWRTVGGLPYYAAAFVVASGPHHSVNTIKNMLTGANEFAHGASAGNQLIIDAQADSAGPNGDPGSTKNTEENVGRLRPLIEQAADLIDTKAGHDGAGYKTEVVRIATAAAGASKDGVLGTSGEAVNEQESAALAALAQMLGTSPPVTDRN